MTNVENYQLLKVKCVCFSYFTPFQVSMLQNMQLNDNGNVDFDILLGEGQWLWLWITCEHFNSVMWLYQKIKTKRCKINVRKKKNNEAKFSVKLKLNRFLS